MTYGITDILSLMGALALFLYGMKVMSDALLALAGANMRKILATTTSNRLFAVLTGLTTTTLIQSSSATTLMVVSFANAGLLPLTEAIGVVMGANIGTTVTAWLIAILGFKVSIGAIALPLISLGFALTLLKNQRCQHWGYFVIGFCLLFIGLQFLKDSLPDIRNNPQVLHFLTDYTGMGYASVLLFLLFGTVLTLIVQSSSATMALTLLATYEGWVPFDMAAAMVLGENIGTTITANIAALVGNHQAKRVARAHLIFNMIGVTWMLLLFYPFLHGIDALVQQIEGSSPFAQTTAVPVALSLFHTLFNVLNTCLLLGFVHSIAHTVQRLVPEVAAAEVAFDQPIYLSRASLEFPQTAMKALFDESMRLLQHAGYQAITHGLCVHREDLASDKKLKDLVKSTEVISVDIPRLYNTRIKSVYSQIVAYATRLQSTHTLEADHIEAIRNILIADRQLVHTVKRMQPLHDNLLRYLRSGNPAIIHEYNMMRRRILKVMREIHRASASEYPLRHIRKLKGQRKRAAEIDALLSGRIHQLLLAGTITNSMATSLINDSEEAAKIVQSLIDIATLLYFPRDKLLHAMEEETASAP